MEIQSVDELVDWLAAERPLEGVRLQDLDLTPVAGALRERDDLHGLVVLGGHVPPDLAAHLLTAGAVVFPGDPDAPVDVFRAHLYAGDELFAGLDGPGGYAVTPDARAYAWSRDAQQVGDAYATLLRAIHDDSVGDALDEWVEGRRVVGVMGGHSWSRGSSEYASAARLGHQLAGAGFVVATGGGPGAMEAANLGAVAPSSSALSEGLARLRAVPSYRPDVGEWVRSGFTVRDAFGPRVRPQEGSAEPFPDRGTPGGQARSLGVPTWYYGHEPPNVFAEGIAKFFNNAIREDGLLARCNAGVVILPGEAGTVQEVFQQANRLYYWTDGEIPPLVLVGVEEWTETWPVWPLLQAMAAGRPMENAIHLVADCSEVLPLLLP